MAAEAQRSIEPLSADAPIGSVLDELLTSREVASILQMRVSTVQDYARRGVLPSIKLGRHRRFLRSQVASAILELSDSRK